MFVHVSHNIPFGVWLCILFSLCLVKVFGFMTYAALPWQWLTHEECISLSVTLSWLRECQEILPLYVKRWTVERWLEGTSISPPWVFETFWFNILACGSKMFGLDCRWQKRNISEYVLLYINDVLELEASEVAFIATMSWPLCWYLWS